MSDLARELDLYAAAAAPSPVPDRVSGVLIAAGVADPWAMDLAARDARLARLATALGNWPAWMAAPCTKCGAMADLLVTPEEVRAAYPEDTATGITGADERAALDGTLDENALAARLGLPGADALDAALASQLPAPALTFDCPACGVRAPFAVDLLGWIAASCAASIDVVASLAAAFGWSEATVAALPPARRVAYLARTGDWA